MRVLLVEDEEHLAERVAGRLRRDAIAVDVAYDGTGALAKLESRDYDVVVLDRELPGVHGDEVCRWMVERRLPSRVLMLTASGSVAERVGGLALGADDCLPKPFEYAELLARVLALGRRVHPALPPVIEHSGLVLDTARRQATRHGRLLPLTRKELAVLEVLLGASGIAVSHDDLVERVWEERTSYRTNAIRITISKLRAKLGAPPVIDTVPGLGYRIAQDPRAGQVR
ncbi:response regulator transcription factor [Streptomyces sp. NPDC006798]|uniref:response regulator transcription factor n=1 Tax=Streptomyces sp. NPDC006798 TaxID=3155462 RepID=UPI0033E9EFBA